MINYYKRGPRDRKLKELERFESGCWINVTEPDEEELTFLKEEFLLDEHNLHSGLDKHEIPRIEFSDEGIYLIIKTVPQTGKNDINTLLIIIGKSYLLTLSKHQPLFIKNLIEEKNKINTNERLGTLIIMLSFVNKEFGHMTHNIVKSVNLTRDSVTDLKDEDLTELLSQESVLNSMVSYYNYLNIVYERLSKHVKKEKDKEKIEDLLIEGQEIFRLGQQSIRSISNIRNHLEILITKRMNKLIALFTIATVALMIPSMIFSMYGMNIALPGQHDLDIFYYINGGCVIFLGIFILYLYKTKMFKWKKSVIVYILW